MGVALSLLLILLAGCSGDADGADPFDPGDDRRGTSGGPALDSALLGGWRNVLIIEVPGDIQRWTTVWLFDAGGTCRQTVETESFAEGVPRITQRDCTYATAGGRISIGYTGAGTVVFDYFFADFSPDRLVLDGFEYARLP